MQAFFGNIQQPLGLEVDLAARISAGIIAVEAVDLAAGVDRDDVAGADLLLFVGDAVNDRVVTLMHAVAGSRTGAGNWVLHRGAR